MIVHCHKRLGKSKRTNGDRSGKSNTRQTTLAKPAVKDIRHIENRQAFDRFRVCIKKQRFSNFRY